jgi:5-bromo-4-chloroindolyl phosphate hydrolysis protein
MSNARRINSNKRIIHNVRHGIKGSLLYLLPFPVLIGAIISLVKGNFWSTLILGASFAGFMLSAIIARHGFKLEAKYVEKKLARAPGTPYKTVAAILLSITTGMTAYLAARYGLFSSILMGGATFIAFLLSYGLDPRRDKTGSLGVTADEVIDALEAAEIKITGIDEARAKIKNLDFDKRLRNITKKAREILQVIEEDPKDLQRARKFLKVYLSGTERVAQSYAKTHKNDATTVELDADFSRVLDSIEQTFAEQHRKLKENDQFDLDVQIEVLETQLKHVT